MAKRSNRRSFALALLLLSGALCWGEAADGAAGAHITLVLTGGPFATLNLAGAGAPTPVQLTLGLGAEFPLAGGGLAFGVFFSGATQYYSWKPEQNRALPSEIENRTALVAAVHADFLFLGRLTPGAARVQFGAGATVAARYGFAAYNVREDVSEDVGLINQYLWSGLGWLYPAVYLSAEKQLPSGVSVGLALKAALNLQSLVDGAPLDQAMLHAGVRVAYALKPGSPAKSSVAK